MLTAHFLAFAHFEEWNQAAVIDERQDAFKEMKQTSDPDGARDCFVPRYVQFFLYSRSLQLILSKRQGISHYSKRVVIAGHYHRLPEEIVVIRSGMNARTRGAFPPLALSAVHHRTRGGGGEMRNRYAEDRSRNVFALLVIGLLAEGVTLAFLIYSIVF